MDYGEFLGTANNIQELINIISRYPQANIDHAAAYCYTCGYVEIYYNEETNTITFT